MKRLTVRWHLTIWNSVVLAALFGVLCLSMLYAVHGHLVSQADQFMMEELQELLEDLRSVENNQALAAQLTRRYAVHSHYHFQVLDAAGQPVFRSRFLSRLSLPSPAPPETMRGYQ